MMQLNANTKIKLVT